MTDPIKAALLVLAREVAALHQRDLREGRVVTTTIELRAALELAAALRAMAEEAGE